MKLTTNCSLIRRSIRLGGGLGILGLMACSESPMAPVTPGTPGTTASASKRDIVLSMAPGFVSPTGLWLDISGGKIDSLTVGSGAGVIVRKLSGPTPNGGGQFVLVKEGGLPTGTATATIWGPAGDGYLPRVVEAAAANFSLMDPSSLTVKISK